MQDESKVQKIGPGIYGQGRELHIDLPELLAFLGLPRTPENENRAIAHVRDLLSRAGQPEMRPTADPCPRPAPAVQVEQDPAMPGVIRHLTLDCPAGHELLHQFYVVDEKPLDAHVAAGALSRQLGIARCLLCGSSDFRFHDQPTAFTDMGKCVEFCQAESLRVAEQKRQIMQERQLSRN